MRTVVGIATRGDRDLRPLIEDLRRQSHPPVRVVVATQGARPAVPPHEPGAMALTVLRVGGAGFARGRNVLLRYLELSRGQWDVAAFLDDDERPDPWWIEEHLRVLREYDADVSFGPIRRLWPAAAAPAVRRADLPQRPDHPEGPYADDGRTGNYALRARLLAGEPTRFEDRLGGSGGEDTAYFHALRVRGATTVWSPRAGVAEEMTPAQCRAAAVLRRSWRNGRTLPVLVGLGYRAPAGGLPPYGQGRRAPKAVVLLLAALVLRRGDLLLRAGWEAAFLAGLAAGLLVRVRPPHPGTDRCRRRRDRRRSVRTTPPAGACLTPPDTLRSGPRQDVGGARSTEGRTTWVSSCRSTADRRSRTPSGSSGSPSGS